MTTPVPEQTLTFESGGRTLNAEVYRPAVNAGAAPGVLVIHEAFGLNDDIRAITARFARAGYVALAVDLFSGRHPAACMVRLMGGLFLNSLEHQGVHDTRRALDVLGHLDGVDAARLGAVGFCLGGSLAVAMACTDDHVKAVAPYYGFAPRPAEALRRACPVVGSFPERDVTRKQGERMQAELTAAGIPNDIKIYPGARHSFANHGPAFDAVASEDAWSRVMTFFDEHVVGRSDHA
ncbi:carboxymethylenebutenolidase [Deinococcus metalli]|uniref:Carboxymethylenebutenolidase n=1 Tax=Deinococcus metalli TaxID=1141878 RepID=A0A7W8KDQ7_9DEIO|nr:dienelactone hydrolase family protein [Deinococcus metalli]MBB5376256.1 carboxymethylenebutenolidase [Deinococcus metalli]GHF39665.1 carboxymethylenebutenolidase [Deinococcus metalli]